MKKEHAWVQALARRERVITEFEAHGNVKKIAEQEGISRERVYQILKSEGYKFGWAKSERSGGREYPMSGEGSGE